MSLDDGKEKMTSAFNHWFTTHSTMAYPLPIMVVELRYSLIDKKICCISYFYEHEIWKRGILNLAIYNLNQGNIACGVWAVIGI